MSLSPRESKVIKSPCNPLKAERLEARISQKQKSLFQHAAELTGRTLTDFVISTLQEIATRVVHEHKILHLTTEDSQVFIKALLKPPKPNKSLLSAVKRYKKEVVSK